jgi:hypothetical protein
MSNLVEWTAALHLAWFLALFIAWGWMAGQSGSPVPDNWPLLERALDILVMSARLSLLLLVLAPVAWYAASKDSRWALGYPVLLFLVCGSTVVLCVLELSQPIPRPAFAAPPRHPCWRAGPEIPAVDAVGKPIQPDDLVVIRSAPGSDAPLADTPEQAAERKACLGKAAVLPVARQCQARTYTLRAPQGPFPNLPPDQLSLRKKQRVNTVRGSQIFHSGRRTKYASQVQKK